jgi:UPF0755 protein
LSVLKRLFALLILLPAFTLAGLAAFGLWWIKQPLVGADGAPIAAPVALEVAPGSSSRTVARAVSQAGVGVSELALYAWFRASGRGTEIKAGFYEIAPGATPGSLLDQLVRGEQALVNITLIEGWNARDVFAFLRARKDLRQDLDGLDAKAIMKLIGMPGQHPEGRFFPDTYRVVRNAPASSVLKQASQAMQQRLDEAWARKSPRSVLKSPEEALILASIIEKETGAASDRTMIAGVFNNRLRIGMRLQTDPTVIYGLGEQFDGNLRRRDLQADTPYNSYTRAGLPPTPISMPGWEALLAAVQPADTQALYFVARGDGSSHFSGSLDEHNSAVRRYILNR